MPEENEIFSEMLAIRLVGLESPLISLAGAPVFRLFFNNTFHRPPSASTFGYNIRTRVLLSSSLPALSVAEEFKFGNADEPRGSRKGRGEAERKKEEERKRKKRKKKRRGRDEQWANAYRN